MNINDKFNRNWARCIVCILCAVVGMVSCAPAFHVNLTAGKPLNVNSQTKKSRSVIVRVYILSDVNRFKGAEFSDLYNPADGYLGSDRIQYVETTVNPNETKEIQIPRDKHAKVRYMGVTALFEGYDEGDWRVVIPVSERSMLSSDSQSIQLYLQHNQLQIVSSH